MFLRFTTQFINPYGELETGIFMAMKYLRDDHPLTSDDDVSKLKILTDWFNRNLEKPARFSTAKSNNSANVSLSWFKDKAKDHIKNVQLLVQTLEKYDILVDRVSSKNPGYIVYEDDYQVSAVPFKADRKRVI